MYLEFMRRVVALTDLIFVGMLFLIFIGGGLNLFSFVVAFWLFYQWHSSGLLGYSGIMLGFRKIRGQPRLLL